jgi:hypothetical protein
MLVVAAVAAIALVAAVAIVVVLNSGNGTDPAAGNGGGSGGTTGGQTTPQQTEEERRFQEGDPEKTIPVSECTSASEYYDQTGRNRGAVMLPDFYDVHIDSVKACIREAGWSYDENLTYVDEVLKGKDMVVDQSPAAFEAYNPRRDDVIELTVSTGLEPEE